MTIAVVAILGHFSKTALLFFIPQIMNFIFSLPQLFHLLPCPRHRLPRFYPCIIQKLTWPNFDFEINFWRRLNPETGLLNPSVFQFKEKSLKPIGRLILKLYELVGLVKIDHVVDSDDGSSQSSNCTLINFAIKILGPIHERDLVIRLLAFQVSCSFFQLNSKQQATRNWYFYNSIAGVMQWSSIYYPVSVGRVILRYLVIECCVPKFL